MKVDMDKYFYHDEETIKKKCEELGIIFFDFQKHFERDMAEAKKVTDALPDEWMKHEFFSDALKLSIIELLDIGQAFQTKFVVSLCEANGIDI